MKKLVALTVSIVMSCGSLYAGPFTNPGASQPITAEIDLSGTGVQEWDVVLKNISGVGTPDKITWQATAGMDQYKAADQYIEVSVNITEVIPWQMVIYTNNTNYSGDVKKGGYGLVGENSATGLPLAWKVQESSHTVTPVLDPVFSIERDADEPEGFTDFQWKFVIDKTELKDDDTPAWSVSDTYVRVWDNDGFYWNEGVGDDMDPVEDGDQSCPAQSLDDMVYIYLGAGFHQSVAQKYSTTTLTLEIQVL